MYLGSVAMKYPLVKITNWSSKERSELTNMNVLR